MCCLMAEPHVIVVKSFMFFFFKGRACAACSLRCARTAAASDINAVRIVRIAVLSSTRLSSQRATPQHAR